MRNILLVKRLKPI